MKRAPHRYTPSTHQVSNPSRVPHPNVAPFCDVRMGFHACRALGDFPKLARSGGSRGSSSRHTGFIFRSARILRGRRPWNPTLQKNEGRGTRQVTHNMFRAVARISPKLSSPAEQDRPFTDDPAESRDPALAAQNKSCHPERSSRFAKRSKLRSRRTPTPLALSA